MKVGKPCFQRGLELLSRFHLFCQHVASLIAQALDQFRPLDGSGPLKIDLDKVRSRRQRGARIISHIVVEGDRIAGSPQPFAGRQYQVVRFHAFENLDYRVLMRQQGDPFLEEQFPGAIDKRFLPIAKHVKTHQQGTVERAARCRFGIAGPEKVFDAIPKKQLVTIHLLFAVQNRLSCYKPENLFGRTGCGLETG